MCFRRRVRRGERRFGALRSRRRLHRYWRRTLERLGATRPLKKRVSMSRSESSRTHHPLRHRLRRLAPSNRTRDKRKDSDCWSLPDRLAATTRRARAYRTAAASKKDFLPPILAHWANGSKLRQIGDKSGNDAATAQRSGKSTGRPLLRLISQRQFSPEQSGGMKGIRRSNVAAHGGLWVVLLTFEEKSNEDYRIADRTL
jgi:hypothetical protein